MDVLVRVALLSLSLKCVVSHNFDTTTDVPKYTQEDALFLDDGKYTTQIFNYINDQGIKGKYDEKFNDECYDQYTKCILTLNAHMPVCAFNYATDRSWGYFTAASYCDVYLDNCRRGFRAWRTIDYGECRFWYNDGRDNVFHTRRLYPVGKVLEFLDYSTANEEPDKTPSSLKIWRTNDAKWGIYFEPSINRTSLDTELHDSRTIYDSNLGIGRKEWNRLNNPEKILEVIRNFRRSKIPVSVELLKLLSKQAGNSAISLSKLPDLNNN